MRGACVFPSASRVTGARLVAPNQAKLALVAPPSTPNQGGPPISIMAPVGYQRVPTNLSTTQRRVAARNNPVPLAVRLVLGGAALGAVLYWWPVLDGSYRFLLFVFAIIMWAQFTTGAWSQNAREYRRHTDQLQNNEMKRAWGIFKEAAVGKTAIPINALDRVHARRPGGGKPNGCKSSAIGT